MAPRIYKTETGTIITLTQESYPAADGSNTYWAHAVDAAGNDYRVIWQVVDATAEDMDVSCNWDRYTVQAL